MRLKSVRCNLCGEDKPEKLVTCKIEGVGEDNERFAQAYYTLLRIR